MIEQLHIQNVALIENVEIVFGDGLNVLSGETGAGKSMVIDAINFLLGERIGKDFIRHTAQMAEAEGIVRLKNPADVASIAEMGVSITVDEPYLHIYRSISGQGKTVCKINGKTVTVGMLREISALLVDVHGQHEHQSLLNAAKHIVLLDRFCGDGMDGLKQELGAGIRGYKDIMRAITEISGDKKSRAAQIEILKFQQNEIESARLRPGEEEELTERRRLLAESERLTENALNALEHLYESGDELSALDKISRAKALAADISRLDPTQVQLSDGLEAVYAQLDDVVHDLRKYCENLQHNPRELNDIETRLDLLYTLKRKYGGTVEDIIKLGEKVSERLELIENSDHELERLTAEKRICTAEILSACERISALRKAAAEGIKKRIVETLRELGMINAEFDILIERKKEFSTAGFDRVEFLISPNPGEALKPLAKIASGGEMSRVMLALKTVLADADNIETFIFDEIDTGVSGRTAQQVAEKLALIAKNHQILCISHLPQIAAMADSHFLIEKTSDANSTTTTVSELTDRKITAELARLIGGAKITDATVAAAEEMKQLALQLKRRQDK